MPNYVYVLSNEAMPGLVKTGFTTTSIEQRIKELDVTSVPLPFQCFYAAEIDDCKSVEKKLHVIFSDKRIRQNREFFRVDPNQVKAAVQLVELREVTPRNDVVVDESDKKALQEAVARDERRSRLRFSELQIPVGSTLLFVKDSTITCIVVEDGKVEFRGQITSPSKAALSVVQEMGYNWSAVSGSDYWMYEDETLASRRLRMEDGA